MSYFSSNPFESEESQEGDIETIEWIREQMLADIRSLHEILFGDTKEIDEEYENLSNEQKKICDEFLEFYSICPVCKGENHKDDLLRFYFEKSENTMKLREKLLKLMDKSKNFINKINIGIPCCQCFKKIFSENEYF